MPAAKYKPKPYMGPQSPNEKWEEIVPPADPGATPQVPTVPRREREYGHYGRGTMEEAVIRQNRALELKMAGATHQQIADTLGYKSVGSAGRAIDKALARDNRRIGDARDQFRKITIARTERMIRALWPMALGAPATPNAPAGMPDLFAMDRILKIMERQARILGLDAPTHVTITDDTKAELARAMSDLEKVLIPGEIVAEPLGIEVAEEVGEAEVEDGGNEYSDQATFRRGETPPNQAAARGGPGRRAGSEASDLRDWGLAAEGAAGELGPLPLAGAAEEGPDDGHVDDARGPGDR